MPTFLFRVEAINLDSTVYDTADISTIRGGGFYLLHRVHELAKDLGCHPRTVYRDLEALQAAGFPIYTERVEGKNVWSLLDVVKHQIPIPFSFSFAEDAEKHIRSRDCCLLQGLPAGCMIFDERKLRAFAYKNIFPFKI